MLYTIYSLKIVRSVVHLIILEGIERGKFTGMALLLKAKNSSRLCCSVPSWRRFATKEHKGSENN